MKNLSLFSDSSLPDLWLLTDLFFKVILRLRSVSQSVFVSSTVWDSWPDIYYCLTVTVLFLWGALSDERMGSFLPSPSHIATDGQSVSKSSCRAPWPDVYYCWTLRSCFLWAPSLTRGWACLFLHATVLPAQSFSGPSPLRLAAIFYCLKFETSFFVASEGSITLLHEWVASETVP
jgi:hypothetical protein